MEQPCPTCGRPLPANPRYPRYVCPECVHRARDATGRPVRYWNATVLGTGLVAEVQRGGEWVIARQTSGYGPFECWIDGIPCEAAEAYFGGVVIQARTAP